MSAFETFIAVIVVGLVFAFAPVSFNLKIGSFHFWIGKKEK